MDRLGRAARRELVYLAFAAMDVCISVPLLAPLFSRVVAVQPVLMAAGFLIALLAVSYLARASLFVQMPPGLRVALFALAVTVSALLTVHRVLHGETRLLRPAWLVSVFAGVWQANAQWIDLSKDVLIFLLVVFLWWRGLVLARRRVSSESVAFRFRLGVVLLAVTTGLGGLIREWQFTAFIFGFFFAALTGIALARADEVADQYGGAEARFDLGWLTTLAGSAVLTLTGAAVVAMLLNAENVAGVLQPVWSVAQVALGALFYLIGLLVEALVLLLRLLVGEIRLDNFRDAMGELRRLAVEPPVPAADLDPARYQWGRAIGVAAGVLLVVLAVALSVQWLRRRALERTADERESVWDGQNLRAGLRDLLARGRRRLADAAAALARSGLGRVFTARTVRRVYAELGVLAQERGFGRALFETPYEYLPTLGQAFPDRAVELALITEAYVAVHYGEAPEQPATLSEVLAAWQSIRETARP